MTKPNISKHNFRKPTMRPPRKRLPPKNDLKQPNSNWLFWLILGFIFLMLMSQSNSMAPMGRFEELSYNTFYSILEGKDESRHIKALTLVESTENTLKGSFEDGTQFKVIIPQNYDESLLELIRANVDDFSINPNTILIIYCTSA